MTAVEEGDIVLRLLHTADWHLGRRFRSFTEENERKLTRARLDVLDRILLAAERYAVDAVLCAGDLFDEPCPEPEWWQQVATRLEKRKWKNRPVFLLPGNHDPFIAESVWAKDHKFRSLLPDWVHVVDREDFEYTLPNNAVLYAVPCMSKAGQRDPTESIPTRAAGDERIRIGMVHGSTFDVKDCQTNFPIDVDAALTRGLDYLAIGDTHGFRYVPPDRMHPPTIYPGAPEPTAFDERDPGSVAVVLGDRRRRAHVTPERVARWTWEEKRVTTLAELNELSRRDDLGERVLRLTVDMKLSAPDYEIAEGLLEGLEGTDARHAKVGVLSLDRQGLALDTSTVDTFCNDLPDVLLSAVRRLKTDADDPLKRQAAERALFHLYRVSRKKAS
jgi:DNA repair exonuclease SbcCD nuclease subunit